MQGEYIAPEKIENVYVRSPFVLQAFVYGNSLRAQARRAARRGLLACHLGGGGVGWGGWGAGAEPATRAKTWPPPKRTHTLTHSLSLTLTRCFSLCGPAQLVCVVVPDPEYLLPWAEQRGLPRDLPRLCQDPKASERVFARANCPRPPRLSCPLPHLPAHPPTHPPTSHTHPPTHPPTRPRLRWWLLHNTCLVPFPPRPPTHPPTSHTRPPTHPPTPTHPPPTPQVVAAVHKSMLEEGRATGLKGFEQASGPPFSSRCCLLAGVRWAG